MKMPKRGAGSHGSAMNPSGHGTKRQAPTGATRKVPHSTNGGRSRAGGGKRRY